MPALASGVAVLLLLGVAAAQTPPPVVARQGYFFVGGTYFDAQDGRPALVKAIVALEPSGPPVHDNVEKGAPGWVLVVPGATVTCSCSRRTAWTSPP